MIFFPDQSFFLWFSTYAGWSFSKTSLINSFKTVLKAKTATGSQACSFIKKEALAQVFFCEFCKIFKNTFFYITPLADGCVGKIIADIKKTNLSEEVWRTASRYLFRLYFRMLLNVNWHLSLSCRLFTFK